MTDPYKVLGVSEYDSDEDIKKAYRELAKKYHPDAYLNNPLKDLAQEKMKQINEAYDEIRRIRQSGAARTSNSSTGTSSSGYSYTVKTDFERVRLLINSGRRTEAGIVLDNVPEDKRNAEWYFLKGCVYYQGGWMMEARKYFEKAVELEPQNLEFRQALDNLAARGNYTSATADFNCSLCRICTSIICCQCVMECCDGCK